MRKTVIAVLLILAMLFVSCSPENKKAEETTKPADTTTPAEPTAKDFLSAYLSGMYSYNIVNKLWNETKATGETALSLDNVNTDEFRNFLTGNLDDETTRYTVTEITSASGTLKSSSEGKFELEFTYDVETSTDGKTWTKTEGQTGKTGYLTGSCKIEGVESTSQSSSNASLNFNAYTVDGLPDISARTATSYKDTKLYNSTNGFTRAELDGVALSDAELKKVSDFIKSLPSE